MNFQFLQHLTNNNPKNEHKVQKKYQKINGCSRQFQCQQLFWSAALLALMIMYSIFVVPVFMKWTSPALILFMCIAYIAFVIMVYEYFYLTITDPVDPRITGSQFNNQQKIKYCSICKKDVEEKTFHCMRCQRCTYKLDHHSQMVNNCVSMKDIKHYLRMITCLTLLLIIIAIESTYIFAMSYINSEVSQLVVNKWIVIALGTLASISVVTTGYNMIFCFYVNVYRQTERIDYLYRQSESNNSQIQSTYKASSTHSSQREIKDAQPNSNTQPIA